ncbi:MAG: Eco57I restriction-modification methylase domain-containing protein [Candidatus Enterousia sp.]
MATISISDLQSKWELNKEGYKTKEIGGGVHDFISDVFQSHDLFNLQLLSMNQNKKNSFVHDTEANKNGRPDFILYINSDIVIPVEAKPWGHITEGEDQLVRYQTALDTKEYGILTDGFEWRFYRGGKYTKFTLDSVFANSNDLMAFWGDYLKPENYYIELFNPSGQLEIFETKLSLNDPENRKSFFVDTTKLISKFKTKMKNIGAFDLFGVSNEKLAVETSYSYLIQFILYKVLVDNKYGTLSEQYNVMLHRISKSVQDKYFYEVITTDVSQIADFISKNVYIPFKKEQESITAKLAKNLNKDQLTIDDIAPWLDIISYINKYDFSNLKNEIFGFIYENYLKDLYHDKNKGQYFTDPAVVNFMLKEIGYTESELKRRKHTNEMSIIDPSCGAGTFLYSAVDKIISAFNDDTEAMSKHIEELINNNIFGLDIEEFPLYLAEMSILMRLLPLLVTDKWVNPIDDKFKIFKTKDSISEFLDVGINASAEEKIDLFSHLKESALDYPSFMRDEKDLQAMMESLQKKNGHRGRFDFVIGNPPYIGYNDCCRQKQLWTTKIADKHDNSINMGDVYGVNLHSVPNNPKKYAPKPNLYAFFIALGLALLKDGGKICYIIPQTILTETDYDVMRYHLSYNTTIQKIITFGGNLFIGRGLKQNKPVATSSLIFVVKKEKPSADHKIKIVNYNEYNESQSCDFEKYFNSHNKNVFEVSQSYLRDNYSNWNILKCDEVFAKFYSKYRQNTEDMSVYYSHSTAEKFFGCRFYFDGGLGLEKNKITQIETENVYFVPKLLEGEYLLSKYSYYPKEAPIKVPQGSQGIVCFSEPFKIIWRKAHRGHTNFVFTDKRNIMMDPTYQFISSSNKYEIYYLHALLNSKINNLVLQKLLKLGNEKLGIFIVIKRLKNFIRIPKITSENQFIKDEIIKTTEQMLDLEKTTLRDIVNFNGVQMQQFNTVAVIDNTLKLDSLQLNIPEQYVNSVKTALKDKYFDKKGNPLLTEIRLSELKSLPIVDFEYQQQLKKYIDDLVFALYFNIPLKNVGTEHHNEIVQQCQENEFYMYVNK